jgi:N-acetylglutamate synthase
VGYRREGESCVLYGPIEAIENAKDREVQLLSSPTSEWLKGMAALQNYTLEQRQTYRRIVGKIAVPAAFAALRVDGKIAALAYGAIHNRLLCYESVVSDARLRRRGYARRVIAALAAWARDSGADGVCLEVEAANGAALALYDTIGLRQLYRYHYRRETLRQPGCDKIERIAEEQSTSAAAMLW